MPTIDDLIKSGVNHYSYYQPEEKPAEDGNFVRGVKTAIRQIPQTGGGALALAGDVIGSDGLRDYGMQIYKNQEQKIQDQAKESDSLTSVLEGKGSFADWLAHSAGYGVGQAVTAVATGGAGGFIGSQLAKRGIREVIARGAESAMAKEVAGNVAARGAKIGAGTALFGSNLTQEAGSIYPDAAEQATKEGRTLDGGDLARVAGSAVTAAGVDTAMDAIMLGRVLKGGRKPGEGILKGAAREVPGAMGREAATEAIQTGIERFGAGQDLTTADAIRSYVDAAGQAVVSGGMGGAAAVLHAQKVPESGPLTRAANTSIDDKILQLQHDPQPLISFPDGSVGHKQDLEAYLSQFPTEEERIAKRRELMGRDPATGKRPEAPPEPTSADNEVNSNANIKAWSEQHDPVPLDYAQSLLQTPGAKGMELMIAPHESGKGYTVIPSKWLSLDAQAKAMALQKGDEARLPAPGRAAPNGAIRVDSEGGAAPETYGEQSRTNAVVRKQDEQAAAEAQRRKELGTPVPKGVPNDRNGTADQAADAATGGADAVLGSGDLRGNAATGGKQAAAAGTANAEVQNNADANGPSGADAVILNPKGKPFLSKFSAQKKLRDAMLTETHDIVSTDDGYVIKPKPIEVIDQAAHAAATSPKNDLPEPTKAQKEAGNYKVGRVKLHGLDISIENPEGSTRSGTDKDGKAWSNTMNSHYGYIRRTEGADGDHVDTFIGKNPDSDRVFIIDQVDPSSSAFDEHKVMLGFDAKDAATKAYQANYAKGWKGGKQVHELGMDDFKAWLKDGDTTKPYADTGNPASEQNQPVSAATEPAPAPAEVTQAAQPAKTEAQAAAGPADKVVADQPEEFIKSPSGSIDFGEITADQATAMKRQAGKIRLERGNKSYGEIHIENGHGKQIRGLGYTSVADYVADALKDVHSIWKPSKTSQMVIVHAGKKGSAVFIELRPAKDEAGDYYRVNSAFPTREGYAENKGEKEGWVKLWGDMDLSSKASGKPVQFAVSPQSTGEAVTNPSGQSGASVDQNPPEGKPQSVTENKESAPGGAKPKAKALQDRDAKIAARKKAKADVTSKDAKVDDDKAKFFKQDQALIDQAVKDGIIPAEVATAKDDGKPAFDPKPAPMTVLEKIAARRNVDALNKTLATFGIDPVKPLFEAPTESHALAKAIAKVFGTQVQFVSDNSTFEGVAHRGIAYLKAGLRRPELAIAGHEVLHTLEQSNPKLATKLHEHIRQYLQDDAISDRQVRESLLAGKQVSEREAASEVLADINGAMWLDPKFWREMRARDENLFRQVAYKFMELTTKAVESLAGTRFDAHALVTDVDVVRSLIAQTWADHIQGNEKASVQGDVAFSRAQEGTPAFKKWFGDSKVVDADGKPLVVYHGTASDISEFDGRSKYEGGIYFTADPRYATGRARIAQGMGHGAAANVMPVYLSIKNPAPSHMSVAQAKDEGFDGIIRGNEFVAFRPEQIKSATGNNGDFNPDDHGVAFSRAGDMADSFMGKLGVQENIRTNVSDLFQSEKTFNSWWHKTVGTQYHKAQVDKHFKRVYDAVQRYLSSVSTFANDAADLAPTLLPKLDGLRDLTKKPPSKADTEAAGNAIFNGSEVDKKVYSDAELRSKFKLADKQIGMYHEFRAATNKSLDDVGKTDMLRYVGEQGRPVLNAVMAAKDVMEAANLLAKHLDSVGDQDAAKIVRAKAEGIMQLKQEGYAPFMRFGEHTVYVVGPKGEQLFFGMMETGREAAELARSMKEIYPEATVTKGILSKEGHKLFAGISPDTMEVLARVTGLAKDPLFQDYYKLVVNNRSALKRLIHRKGIAGYSKDTTRVLASFLTSNARAASKNLHGLDMSTAANDIPKEKGDVRDEAIKLVDYIQNPVEEAAKIRGLLFTNFIGGSIASAAVNMTQPVMMTLPYLSQFAGIGKATTGLLSAMKMAATVSSDKIADKGLRDAMQRAENEGIVSPQEIHNLQAEAMRSSKGFSIGGKEIVPAFAARKIAVIWGGLFGLAEQFNRRTTFIAAYEMAKGMSKADLEKADVANAYEFATKAIAETQGVYNRGNRPDWARGALGATLMTFKQYSVSYMEFLKRLPPKERALALAILVVASGANGLPFADDLDDVIDTIGQALGYNMNIKKVKDRVVTNVLGQGAADFVLHGFSGVGGLPLDVSMRMGMGNLLPATGLLLKSEKDKSRQYAEVLGAAGGYGQKILAAGGKLLEGDVPGAMTAMASTATTNVIKAVDMMQTDAYRDTKGRKVIDTDMVDAIVKGIGFQPSNVAQEQRSLSVARQDIDMANTVKAEIADKWAQGVFEKDSEAPKKAREAINAWNEKNPESRITIDATQITRRLREMRMTKEQRVIKHAPKSMRAAIRSELE